jgi:hypothetical protein
MPLQSLTINNPRISAESTVMLSENESEPFLRESGNAPSEICSLERQYLYGRLSSLRNSWRTLPPLVSHCLVFIVTSLLWGCYLLLIPTRSFSPQILDHSEYNSTLIPGANYYHCGNSTEAAKAKGCQYDILNNHWVPAQCMDQDAIREYQSDGSWLGYADANRTEPLSIDAMSEMPVYYTNERDHIVHCAMLWRKQFRAFFEGRKYLDSIIVDEEHTIHCSKYLIEMSEWGPDFTQIPIKVFVGYAGCHVKD